MLVRKWYFRNPRYHFKSWSNSALSTLLSSSSLNCSYSCIRVSMNLIRERLEAIKWLGVLLPYVKSTLAAEVVLVFALAANEVFRAFFGYFSFFQMKLMKQRNVEGWKGNLTETGYNVVTSLILGFPCLAILSFAFCALHYSCLFSFQACLIYLIWFQTYVLMLEAVIIGIQIGLIGLQMLFSLVTLVSFARWFVLSDLPSIQIC